MPVEIASQRSTLARTGVDVNKPLRAARRRLRDTVTAAMEGSLRA
jgi:hypothetical protein